MATALPAPGSPSAARVPLTGAPLACSAPPIPDGPCPVCPRLAQEFEPWRQASYWKAMYDRARQREDLRVFHLAKSRRVSREEIDGGLSTQNSAYDDFVEIGVGRRTCKQEHRSAADRLRDNRPANFVLAHLSAPYFFAWRVRTSTVPPDI